MIRFIGCGVAVMMLMTATASAEDANVDQDNQIQFTGRSMHRLLNEGYQIQQSTFGMNGYVFTLVKSGKWVICEIEADLKSNKLKPGVLIKAPSSCFALNKSLDKDE